MDKKIMQQKMIYKSLTSIPPLKIFMHKIKSSILYNYLNLEGDVVKVIHNNGDFSRTKYVEDFKNIYRKLIRNINNGKNLVKM